MKNWSSDYSLSLKCHFRALTRDLKSKMDQVVAGRAVPSTANITIGSGRKVKAAVLFFDIRGSSHLSDVVALYTLNAVLPTMMRIVRDHDGYIEKNTGDGVMAIFTAMDDKSAAKAALQAAMVMFHSLRESINPHLVSIGYHGIEARVGIDFGAIYVSRVGLPRGSADQEWSFLTAIGPAANIACRLQDQAGTNEIWVGQAIVGLAPQEWLLSFKQVWPDKTKWNWFLEGTSKPYPAYHFDRSLPSPVPTPASVPPGALPKPPLLPHEILATSLLQKPQPLPHEIITAPSQSKFSPVYLAMLEYLKKK